MLLTRFSGFTASPFWPAMPSSHILFTVTPICILSDTVCSSVFPFYFAILFLLIFISYISDLVYGIIFLKRVPLNPIMLA